MRMCLKGVERVLRFFETCEKVKKDTRSGVSVQVLVGVMRSESDPPSSYPIFSFLYFLLFDLFYFFLFHPRPFSSPSQVHVLFANFSLLLLFHFGSKCNGF